MTDLTAIERAEVKWQRRGQNILSRYLNWASLRHPWVWRVRLELVALFVLASTILFTATLIVAKPPPVGEYHEGIDSFIVGGAVFIAIVAPLAAGLYWIFAVTKSIRARSQPRLGRAPGMLTALAILCAIGFWAPVLVMVGSKDWYDPATGASWSTSEEPAAAEAPADAPADPAAEPADPAAAPADPAAAPADPIDPQVQARTALQEEQEYAERDAYERERRARFIQPSLMRALFDRPTHSYWQTGGLEALRAFAESTPPWSSREHLFHSWRDSGALMFEPGLLDAFKQSDSYRAMLAGELLTTMPWEELSAETRNRLVESARSDINYRLQTYTMLSPDYTVYAYLTALRRYLESQGDAPLEDYQSLYSVSVGYASDSVVREAASRTAQNNQFQTSDAFTEFAKTNYSFSQDAEAMAEVQSHPGYDAHQREFETHSDPRVGLAVDGLRYNLMNVPILFAIGTLCVIGILAAFATGLNWGGLGVTLGSAMIAAALVVGGISVAATISTTTDYTFSSQLSLTVTAIIALLLPLLFVVKDLLGGVLRRGSRLAALTTVWAGGFGLPVIAAANWTTLSNLSIWPNELFAMLAVSLLTLFIFGLYATLIHKLIARIASYPQPG